MRYAYTVRLRPQADRREPKQWDVLRQAQGGGWVRYCTTDNEEDAWDIAEALITAQDMEEMD